MPGNHSEFILQRLVVLENSQPYEVRAVGSDGKLRKVIGHIQRNQDTRFARACGSITSKRRLGLLGKGFEAVRFYREYLSNHDTVSPTRLGDGIDSRQNEDTSFRAQRTEQQHIVGVSHEIVHGFAMLSPQWPVIESRIHHGASVNRVETSNPCEAGPIAAFEERAGRDCPQLLKGLGKIAFKVLSEMLAVSFLGGVA